MPKRSQKRSVKTPLEDKLRQTAAVEGGLPSKSSSKVSVTIKPPPTFVKCIRDLIYWEYSKLVAEAAGFESNYGFIVSRFKKLKTGEMKWADADQDAKKMMLGERACVYCGCESDLSMDHIIPKVRGGPDIPANIIPACKSCNSSKGDKDLFQWYFEDKKADTIPPKVWKRYLKLVWDFHVLHRSLDKVDVNQDGRLDLLDLSAIFRTP